MKRKVFSFNSELFMVTGIQKVFMDIHHAIYDEYEAKIVGTIPFSKVHKDLDIQRKDYIRFLNPFIFYKSIVILHQRKFLPVFWLLNHVLFQRISVVYIHHNLFNNLRLLSIMPKTVVAISDEGVRNLHEYFGVPKENIHKIYNCVDDVHPVKHNVYSGGIANILYPGRINDQKRQLMLVDMLKDKLTDKVKILFAGTGQDIGVLQDKIKDDTHFECLGYRSDIYALLQKCDFMMLFSGHEGLPISLIEANMLGVPAICSDVGGNREIVENGSNGFVINKDDWKQLVNTLNSLPDISVKTYQEMSSISRKRYLKYFTFEIFKKHYLELLNKL